MTGEAELRQRITDRWFIDHTKKTIRYRMIWPYDWLEVCRGHEVRRPWFLRWLWPKLRFHDAPHHRSKAIPVPALYSFLMKEWRDE